MKGTKGPKRIRTIQFHQAYSYEDFVQGIRPKPDGGFAIKNGPFYEFCRQAAADPGNPYVLVVDEINRGNLSKILGELMVLIEADKRGPEFAMTLTYTRDETDTFYVPENVRIIGMMNTADRSLSMVDYALRRRFAFFDLVPLFDSSEFEEELSLKGVDREVVTEIRERMGAINEAIVGDSANLGRGFAIGHSFFCPFESSDYDRGWMLEIFRTEIRPLLEEYWFDRPEKVSELLGWLHG